MLAGTPAKHQRRGHARQLYDAVMSHVVEAPEVTFHPTPFPMLVVLFLFSSVKKPHREEERTNSKTKEIDWTVAHWSFSA